LQDIIAGMRGAVAEGVFTTQAAVGLARSRGVEMPITEQMDAILHRAKPPAEAIHDLMTRSVKNITKYPASKTPIEVTGISELS
jgi:glycerol-3-phosphate dehydrogenase (NAD(P)+)